LTRFVAARADANCARPYRSRRRSWQHRLSRSGGVKESRSSFASRSACSTAKRPSLSSVGFSKSCIVVSKLGREGQNEVPVVRGRRVEKHRGGLASTRRCLDLETVLTGLAKTVFGMAKKSKKRGPPRTTGTGTLVGLRCHQPFLDAVDRWRERQDDKPTRPAAILRLAKESLSIVSDRRAGSAVRYDRERFVSQSQDRGRPRWLVVLTFPPSVDRIQERLMAAKPDQFSGAGRPRRAAFL